MQRAVCVRFSALRKLRWAEKQPMTPWVTASSHSSPHVATCPVPEPEEQLPAPIRGTSDPTAFPRATSWSTKDNNHLGERPISTVSFSLRLNELSYPQFPCFDLAATKPPGQDLPREWPFFLIPTERSSSAFCIF